jgi:hypothetical protein
MDEREAAHDRGFPSRDFLGASFEMAGTGFGFSGGDSKLVAIFQAPSKIHFHLRKHPLQTLANQHTVSITVEAVACLNSVVVGRENIFAPCERADKSE